MSKGPVISVRTLAELAAHLGRIAYGEGSEGSVEGLTPAQRTALRYFSKANRFSRTVSAFAEFHATTRGTASQTVKSCDTMKWRSRRASSCSCRTNPGPGTRW